MLHLQGNLLVELVLKLGGGVGGGRRKLSKIFAVLHYRGVGSLPSQTRQSCKANTDWI